MKESEISENNKNIDINNQMTKQLTKKSSIKNLKDKGRTNTFESTSSFDLANSQTSLQHEESLA